MTSTTTPEAGDLILGLDPGIGTTGFGLVRRLPGAKVELVGGGVIRTQVGAPDPERLATLYGDLVEVLDQHRPDVVAVEKIFFKKNITTAILVSQARGVLLLAAGQRSLPVFEYSPVEVKSAVAGYGNAPKGQMQEMVRRVLGLGDRPRPDDLADALAVALCHSFRLGGARARTGASARVTAGGRNP